MTATAEPLARPVEAPPKTDRSTHPPLNRGEGVELLGDLHGCGYRDGAALVRRGDGQMVQLGPLMYGLLECIDGRRDNQQLAGALAEKLGRSVGEEHIVRLAEKLAAQGLLAGSEQQAPPRRNPLLALRWKVLVTDPQLTKRLTAPFTGLFRRWVMWPILACFAGVFWFVLIHKGVASATSQAFHRPGLLLLVFALAVVSAGLHELGHAAAARYSGATPGGMGMGLYLVWPAFYTDVTDAYRLPRRDRLRIDLAGLYFNAAIAVITMAVWLVWRVDALLLLIALQVLQMVKQLSPVIRADGYHILSDATGVPDLYSHIGPTFRRLLPGRRREPSALTGRARLLVTVWVAIVVPVLISLMVGAIVLFPRLVTTAWDSGRHIALAMPGQTQRGDVIELLASLLSMVALILPVLGSALVSQKIIRTTARAASGWSRGRPLRRLIVVAATGAGLAAIVWAWWPSGQYQPIRANHGGTLPGLLKLVSAPGPMARPSSQPGQAQLAPGTHLAIAMIPVGGATRTDPAVFVIPKAKGQTAVAILSDSAPNPVSSGRRLPAASASAAQSTSTGAKAGVVTAGPSAASLSSGAFTRTSPFPATAFPFKLPSPPGRGGTQALAVGTRNGAVTYDIAYALVTVRNGAPVTETNSAYALADCKACTTVAVSFQLVLVIGESRIIAPIDAAGALNYDCPACITLAIADQIVVTLNKQPSHALIAELNADLRRLNALYALGASGSPTAVAAEVTAVQNQIETQLDKSGLLTNPITSSTTATTASSSSSSTTTAGASTPSTQPGTAPSTASSSGGGSTTTPASPSGPTSTTTTPTTTTTTPAPPSTTTTTPSTTTPSATGAPSQQSSASGTSPSGTTTTSSQ